MGTTTQPSNERSMTRAHPHLTLSTALAAGASALGRDGLHRAGMPRSRRRVAALPNAKRRGITR